MEDFFSSNVCISKSVSPFSESPHKVGIEASRRVMAAHLRLGWIAGEKEEEGGTLQFLSTFYHTDSYISKNVVCFIQINVLQK
jgi:hypothetical protein